MLSLQRKIELATEGFATKGHQILLSDTIRLSKENALTICEYIIAMKREVNPRLSYRKYTIQFLSELSKTVGDWKTFSRDDTRRCSWLFRQVSANQESKRRIHYTSGLRKANDTKTYSIVTLFQVVMLS